MKILSPAFQRDGHASGCGKQIERVAFGVPQFNGGMFVRDERQAQAGFVVARQHVAHEAGAATLQIFGEAQQCGQPF